MNPYKILGLDNNASKDDIKKAYRNLSKKHHPDINGGDDTKFKKISDAYKILTDPKAKSAYEEEKMRQTHRNNPFGRGFYQSNGPQNVDDILREFMKANGFGNPEMRYHTKIKKKIHGRPINVKVFLNLEDAFHGKVIEIKIDRYERINSEKRVLRNKRIKVTIPKGAKNSQQLVLRNQGNQGINGGSDGDIYINIEIKPHKYFLRKDHDLFTTIKVPFTQVILGDSVKFKNLNGEMLDVIIPPGTGEDDEIEIRGKGMPIGNSDARGSLRLIVAIEMPGELTEDQKNVFRIIQNQIGRKSEVVPESIL